LHQSWIDSKQTKGGWAGLLAQSFLNAKTAKKANDANISDSPLGNESIDFIVLSADGPFVVLGKRFMLRTLPARQPDRSAQAVFKVRITFRNSPISPPSPKNAKKMIIP
jgi:hypothetical protein